jgi:hypothetical protein
MAVFRDEGSNLLHDGWNIIMLVVRSGDFWISGSDAPSVFKNQKLYLQVSKNCETEF